MPASLTSSRMAITSSIQVNVSAYPGQTMAALSLRTWCASRKKSPHSRPVPRMSQMRSAANLSSSGQSCRKRAVFCHGRAKSVENGRSPAAEPFHATPVCVSALSVPCHVQLVAAALQRKEAGSRSGRRKDRKGSCERFGLLEETLSPIRARTPARQLSRQLLQASSDRPSRRESYRIRRVRVNCVKKREIS